MVAGGSTCTCAQCGAVCRGRFTGCVDVWARGPRSVTVRVKPTEEPVRRSRPAPIDVSHATEALRIEAPRIDVHTNGTGDSGADVTSTTAMLDPLWEKLRELESAVSERKEGAPPANARLEALSNAVSGIASGLDRLLPEVGALQALPARLEGLEADVKQKQAPRLPYDQTLPETVSRIAGKVDELEKVQGRLEALERAAAASHQGGVREPELVRRLEQVSAKVASFEQVSARVTALEQAKRTSTDSDLATLAGRVKTLEQAEPTSDHPAPVAGELFELLDRLSKRVAALEEEKAPAQGPGDVAAVQLDRLAATEKVLGGLVHGLEHLSAQVVMLDEVPKRLEALEESKSPPPDKVLTSISKRLDRLSTQVSSYRDLPERVEAAEQGSGRVDVLARGLHRAIESIDHLSAQLTTLQGATPTATGNNSGAPARPLPPVSSGPWHPPSAVTSLD